MWQKYGGTESKFRVGRQYFTFQSIGFQVKNISWEHDEIGINDIQQKDNLKKVILKVLHIDKIKHMVDYIKELKDTRIRTNSFEDIFFNMFHQEVVVIEDDLNTNTTTQNKRRRTNTTTQNKDEEDVQIDKDEEGSLL